MATLKRPSIARSALSNSSLSTPALANPAMSRRGFMVGCSSAIAAMAGAKLSYVAFGSPEDEPIQNILLVIFLRGGIDGMSVVPIIGGPDRAIYEAARADIAIPVSGDNAAIPLGGIFGLHPAAAPLHELYQDGNLAIVHATGLPSDTRSHFDAMAEMELGTPGYKGGQSGWLARHLQSSGPIPANSKVPALSVGNLQPRSLGGSVEAIGINSPQDFAFGGNWRHENDQRSALRKMYGGSSWIDVAGKQTLDAVDVLELGNPGSYEPANGVEYPGNSFGRNLQSVAQMIKLQLGMQIATIDLGGWDTHEYQGNEGTGYFSDQLGNVARSLNAFYTDLSSDSSANRVTTVVMSEFGRSLKQNGSRGTDHGHGNVMLVMGNDVNGGAVYGEWPGLDTDQLYENRDLEITTDYRQVLSEIMIRRFANPNLGVVFPGYTDYTPLNIVGGADLTPIYENVAATPAPTAEPTSTPQPGSNVNPATPTPVATDMPTAMPTAMPTSTPVPNTGPMKSEVFVPIVAK